MVVCAPGSSQSSLHCGIINEDWAFMHVILCGKTKKWTHVALRPCLMTTHRRDFLLFSASAFGALKFYVVQQQQCGFVSIQQQEDVCTVVRRRGWCCPITQHPSFSGIKAKFFTQHVLTWKHMEFTRSWLTAATSTTKTSRSLLNRTSSKVSTDHL